MNTETNMSQSMFSKSEIWKWKKKNKQVDKRHIYQLFRGVELEEARDELR